jgi:sulfite exporter TauE/SafE
VLGIDTLRKVVRGGQIHWHIHQHGGVKHAHPHVHDAEAAHSPEKTPETTHHGLKLGKRPLIVGMIHGLAGSGALMLLILSTISSATVGIAYILVFGVGSIGGMMLTSMLVGLPFHLSANRFARAEWLMRGAAGLFSLGFGLFMVYEIGFIQGLFQL